MNSVSPREAEYLESRAEAEIALAQNAEDPRVVRVHYELATAYLDRIYAEDAKAA